MAERTWAGTHTFAAPHILRPTSIEQVQDAVGAAVRDGSRVRALGTRHSFHDIADTDGTLIDVTGIPADAVLDETARTVTVGGGTRYGALALWLEERGWALHNLGSLPHISVAGATATGTHGSGDTLGTLSTAVRGLEWVDARGELQGVAVADTAFAGYVVHLGAFGIVTRVTLAIEPSFQVRQDAYAGVPWDSVLSDLDSIMSAGYSVSVFARWTDDSVAVIRKTRVGSGDHDDFPDEWLGGGRLRTPIIDSDAWTEQGGVAGPWLHRLPHFRLDKTPSVGDEIQTEYFVPRTRARDALRAVRAMGAALDPHLVVTELRSMRGDNLWLSGAYGRETLAIHFTWLPHPDAVAGLLPTIEAALAPFDARPHWGKWHRFDAARLAAVHPRLADSRALFARLDPAGVFANAHLERLGVR